MKETIQKQLSEKRAKYEEQGLITRHHEASPTLSAQVESHHAWARRYDPVRLAIEHDSFVSEVVSRQGTDPSLPAISVRNPDVCSIDCSQSAESRSYAVTVERHLKRLGLDDSFFSAVQTFENSVLDIRASAPPPP